MGNTFTRATIIWFVAAAVLGAAAVLLHLYRSAAGSSGTPDLMLTVAAYAATALTVVCVYRGIMVAAREQDEAGRRAQQDREVAERLARWEGLRPKDH